MVQNQRTEGWSGDKWGLTHVQRRKSGSSTWSHRPSPTWQHSSARGLMGSPTARASTPRVSVRAKTWLALGSGTGPEECRAKTWGPKVAAGGNSEIPTTARYNGNAFFSEKEDTCGCPGGDLCEHQVSISPSLALGTLPGPLLYPGSGSAQAEGPHGLSPRIPAGAP